MRFFPVVGLLFAAVFLNGCSTFALSYQNYFTKNFAYVSSGYDGNPSIQLGDGAESNNIEDGNRDAYSLASYPTVFFGFRSLEFHNSQYTSGSGMNEVIIASFVAPGKTEAVNFLTLELKGSNINAKPAIAPAKGVTLIKATYPALMVKIDNKALQEAYGSGTYTIVWKSVQAAGKPEDRELSRVVTQFIP